MNLRIPKNANTVWSMNISHFFIEIYLFMHISLIPIFIKEFKLSLFEVSFIATIPTLAGLIVSLVSGLLIDRIGAKPILVLGMALQVFGGFLVAECWDTLLLYVGVTFISTASPLYHNSGLATISRVLENKTLSKAIGIHNAMGSFGAFLGLITLPIILVYRNWRFSYLVWTVPILIWTLLLLRLKINFNYMPKEGAEIKSERVVIFKSFIRFLLSMSLFLIGFVSINTFITSYMVLERGLSEAIASLIYAIGPLIGIISSISAGQLSSRVGDRRFLVLIMIGSAICAIGIPFTPSTSILAIVYLFFSFFSNSVWTPMTSITASLTPLNRRGFAYSLSMSTLQIVFVITPPLIAKIVEFSSLWIMFPISFVLIVMGVLALRISTRSYKLISNK